MEKTALLHQIEETRDLLHKLISKFGRKHPEVLYCSQELDMLLFELYKVKFFSNIA